MSEQEVNPRDILLELALESWRFQKLFGKALNKLDAGEAQRFLNQHRFFVRRIEEALGKVDLKIVNIEGQRFDPGIAATALNSTDFDLDEELVVDQMIEPIVMDKDGLVRTGVVTLRRI